MDKLIVFVKAPVPGVVKTRLVPPLTYEKAADLYRGWAREIYLKAGGLETVSTEVAYQPHADFPSPEWLGGAGPVSFFIQTGADVGDKMEHAFTRAFENGADRVVIVGSDSPGLPPEYLRDAFRFLENHDLVLGPARDGGYYLIGLKKQINPLLFKKVEWSTGRVLAQTLANAERLGWQTRLLPEYIDVDRPEDLELIARMKNSSAG